jgi:hypothetical protein
MLEILLFIYIFDFILKYTISVGVINKIKLLRS